MGAFWRPAPKPGYSLQSFFAARRQKKDFRFYPSRMGGRPFCFTNTGLRPRPACTALKQIATSRDSGRESVHTGEQQSCLQDCDQPPQFPGQFLPGQKLPACTALKKIA
ncbi:MAG: hypothetical protein LBT33_09935, partial [Spirochaetia bacterium]|nr:hypothetical protein [Spirochaetia bacterium]